MPIVYAGRGTSRDGAHPSNPKQWQGGYSAEGLKNNGFVLRSDVVLHACADVIRKVFKPSWRSDRAGAPWVGWPRLRGHARVPVS